VRVQSVGAGRVEELAGFGCDERSESPRTECGGFDVPGDVAGQFVFADGVLQRRLEHRVHVRHGQVGQPLLAALADRAAALSFGVQPLGAALASGAQTVEEGAYVFGGQPCDLLGAEAGHEVETDAGGVSGVGVLPKPVDSDAVQPVGQTVFEIH
jgi:hypothetical protein